MSGLEPTRTYSNPTANDILRRMLDERGVEHYDGTERTLWGYEQTGEDTGIYRFAASEISGGFLQFDMFRITPEQAIAATLGATDANPTQAESSGTCHDEGDPNDFCCSECGVRMFTESNDTYTMIAADGRTIIKHPNFCPNCGRKVVEPTTNDVDVEVEQ